MPSLVIDYIPASGFVALISGNPWSGQPMVPTGGIQLRASPQNSGYIYVSLSGAHTASGQNGQPPTSGGPTITSGTWATLSGGAFSGFGRMDAMPMAPGDTYFIPKIANRLTLSGQFRISVGADPACSGGFARVFYEAF